jgi:hypothetical protein
LAIAAPVAPLSDAKINRFQRETLNLPQFPLTNGFDGRDPHALRLRPN